MTMNQKRIDQMADALLAQGLTWSQANFAVSLVRNSVEAERERCAKIADGLAGDWRTYTDQFRRGAGAVAAYIRAEAKDKQT